MIEKVRAIISRECDCNLEEIKPSSRLDQLPMDSLEFVNVIQCIKNELGSISTSQVQSCETVAELADTIGT